ncbi:MAG TPA: hypothetical protein VFH59_17755 [Frateuria sp.]|uniref:hypothetical protein n=1 Tax=Frateuria sp. TaxID=2211372 RepID=UPI002D7F0031|nr:hypothetical protein [Frateuria sp.]HET6807284.1 hypothetical protein [Frateuria sp.]
MDRKNAFRLAACAALAVASSSCAQYETKVMQPWLGASQAELISKWGYPTSAGDIVNVDSETTVYTYRSVLGGWAGPPGACVVSFTLRSQTVVAWKYNGANCPDILRGG